LFIFILPTSYNWGDKTKRVKWQIHDAGKEKAKIACRVPAGKGEKRNHLENLAVDGRVILK
jgi:hypothetical protein